MKGLSEAYAQYVALEDWPVLTSVEQALRYIEADETLALIDFEAMVDGVALSTHDDGEAAFQTGGLASAVALLEAATQDAALVAAALKHPGKYVLIEGCGETVFDTFDQAIASGRLTPD